MKLLKKPFVAVLLCVLIVLGSSALSARSSLEKKCDAVIDGFYSGVVVKGEADVSIASCLSELCDISDGMEDIAENYGIKSQDGRDLSDALRQSLNRRETNAATVYGEYQALSNYVQTLEDELYHVGLSQRHTDLMTDYSYRLTELTADIQSSGYNDSVRVFMQKVDRFPARYLAAFFGIQYPQYFG